MLVTVAVLVEVAVFVGEFVAVGVPVGVGVSVGVSVGVGDEVGVGVAGSPLLMISQSMYVSSRSPLQVSAPAKPPSSVSVPPPEVMVSSP